MRTLFPELLIVQVKSDGARIAQLLGVEHHGMAAARRFSLACGGYENAQAISYGACDRVSLALTPSLRHAGGGRGRTGGAGACRLTSWFENHREPDQPEHRAW
ncbi:MAG: hypothetical protein ACREJ5_25375 [Geminicoccaceae bacterium]